MEQSPSEANNYSVKKIPAFYGTSKNHYPVRNSSPLVPVLSQINPVQIFLPYFPKIHSNIILPPYALVSRVAFSLQVFQP